MPKFIVEKRIINNYRVKVYANTPEEAIRKAADNDHGPGVLTSENEDGDTFYPSEWRVKDASGNMVEVLSEVLTDLD